MDDLISHNVAGCCFELEVEGHRASLDYVLEDEHMIITHTFVPYPLRGKGLAANLVVAALTHARENRWKVFPQCSYVETFMKRHREYDDLRG
jgi:predicted GNAT family acetyltransferase